MNKSYKALFHEVRSTMLEEVLELMDAQEVSRRTIEESTPLRELCGMKPSAGFNTLFDVAHQAMHDVYLDSYFDDIFRSITARAIEKVIGGYHEQCKSSGSKVRTQPYPRWENSVRSKQKRSHHVLSKRARKLPSLSRKAPAKRQS